MTRELFIVALISLLPLLIFSQGIQKMDIYKYIDVINGPPPSPAADSLYIADIIKYVMDTLFYGGGEISNI
jgi:hypothetical protein